MNATAKIMALRADNERLKREVEALWARLPNEEYERFVRVQYPQMYERLRDAGSEPVTVHIEERANGEVLLVARTHDCPELAALRADKERLDWLDAEALRRRDDETQESYYDMSRVRLDTNTFGVWVGGDLRLAIDSARAAQEASHE